MKEPKTAVEWQEAADAAEGALHLHSARCYGLVKGGPKVDSERCEEILIRAKARRITPAKDAAERFIKALLAV